MKFFFVGPRKNFNEFWGFFKVYKNFVHFLLIFFNGAWLFLCEMGSNQNRIHFFFVFAD